MEYRLISECCTHGARSMQVLRTIREIEALYPSQPFERVYKDGDDVRIVKFAGGLQFRFLFWGERCVLESEQPLNSIGICKCNSRGERFTEDATQATVRRFGLSGFVARLRRLFKRT